MNLLIADDSQEFMESLKDFLENSGHTVFCASDGEQALQTFGNQKIDGVFCALTLPKLGGLELLKEVKSANSNSPFVMLCPQNDSEGAINALQLGACDYLIKSIHHHIISFQFLFQFIINSLCKLLSNARNFSKF